MNKIFRKCKKFGLMVRIKNLNPNEALACAKSLIGGNIPLCLIDYTENGSMDILNNIAFNADLFIAVENISTISDAYNAVGNGAQFFILNEFNKTLMKELDENGFFYITKIDKNEDIIECKNMNLECVLSTNPEHVLKDTALPVVLDHREESPVFINNTLFNIVNIPNIKTDYQLWINSVVKKMLGLNYTEVIINNNASEDEITFAEIFASTNKSKISKGQDNRVILEVKNIELTINYFKWRGIYIDPYESIVKNERIIEGPLDKKINNFTIILKESCNECN